MRAAKIAQFRKVLRLIEKDVFGLDVHVSDVVGVSVPAKINFNTKNAVLLGVGAVREGESNLLQQREEMRELQTGVSVMVMQ